MINMQKARLTAKVALFEQSDGRAGLISDRYMGQRSYFRRLLLNLPLGALLYILLLLLAVLLFPDWLGELNELIGTMWETVILAAGLVVFTVLYSIISDRIIRTGYKYIRSSLCRYKAGVRRLNRLK